MALSKEPDPARLRAAYDALGTSPEYALGELEALEHAGSATAPLYLGWLYQAGKIVEKNDPKAERCFKLSLERGLVLSAYYLGHFYLALDRHKDAICAFERGSELGSVASKYCLAMAILEGKAEAMGIDRAIKLLLEASEVGHVFAMRSLASLYLSGRFGLYRRLHGITLWFKALIFGVFLAINAKDDDERLRA